MSRVPIRAKTIGASAVQLFTKNPNQWREPVIPADEVRHFRSACRRAGVTVAVSHDSYLINLASPDPQLHRRSIECFKGELERCRNLGVRFVVTHPGNYLDHREAGIERNVAAYEECLSAVRGPMILLETTAGAGTALGSTFGELAELRRRLTARFRRRVGFCADTCHLFAAGYDLARDWGGVWREWDRVIGMRHLRCMHLNDSKTPFGSRRDRHELIGEGTLGPEPFRRIMRDRQFRGIIKIIETPKGDDPVQMDRKMLKRLLRYARRP